MPTTTCTTLNREKFFSAIRPLFGKLNEKQVAGMNAILDEWERRKLTDIRWLAYILATVFHETAGTMQPIEEYGKGARHDYGKKLKMGAGPGKRVAYSKPDKLYYGRSYVQITWYENYEKFGKLLGIPLLEQPELALQPDIATQILYEGMLRGLFTGRKLSDYFNATVNKPIGARYIINGQDRAEDIAKYHEKFYAALQ